MTTIINVLGVVLGGLLVAFLLALLVAFPTMLLWNELMPPIFNLPVISFWQALGLLILSTLLIRSSSSMSSSSK